MALYGLIENGICVNIVESDTAPDTGETWVEATGGAGIGWQWDGTTWSEPAPPPTVYRKLLTGLEWVETFTADEWHSLKSFSQQDTTPGRRLDQLLDAIKLTNSIDISSPKMQQFYAYLVNQGWITQARADELQTGISE